MNIFDSVIGELTESNKVRHSIPGIEIYFNIEKMVILSIYENTRTRSYMQCKDITDLIYQIDRKLFYQYNIDFLSQKMGKLLYELNSD